MQFPKYTPEPKVDSDLTRVQAVVLFKQATGVSLKYAKENYEVNWRNRDKLSLFDCGTWIRAYYKTL